jgi:signal transduction histidine kinase
MKFPSEPFGQLNNGAAQLSVEPDKIWLALTNNPEVAFTVVRVLPDGHFLIEQANAAFQMFVTVPWQDLPGRLLSDALLPELIDYAQVNLRHCVHTGQTQSYERAVDLAGRRRAWTTNLVPVRDPDGAVSHIVTFGRPIPFDMYQAGADERNAALVASLGMASPGLIYLFDLQRRRHRLVGGQLSLPLGYKPYEIEEMAEPMRQLLHPDDYDRMDVHYRVMAKLADGAIKPIDFRLRHRDGHYRHFAGRHMVFNRHADGSVALIFGMADDVTDRDRMLRKVDGLSEQLLRLQVEERRRIAQDLHDSTGQHIVAAQLALARIQMESAPGGNAGAEAKALRKGLRDVMASLKEAEREIRVLTYLLHPPAIRDRGFALALSTFANGFARRAAIELALHLDEDVDLLPEEVLVMLLRFSQEGLTNVHRHAKATCVSLRLELTGPDAVLTIADNGKGFRQTQMALEEPTGVGLAGMRDRLERIGGALELHNDGGAVVTARVPFGQPEFPVRSAPPGYFRLDAEAVPAE